MKAQDIRDTFSNFFQSKKHEKISSSPLTPHNDKTLLFVNAGMNQFKDYFTGKITPNHKAAVTIQKCVRAGGKHNDLDNVGLTARHHTFFEMLGNFSFGDYFKEEAILLAWEFLTKVLHIPSEKLYVTVHHSDQEAFFIWNEKVGLPLEKIFKKGDKDNFWEMGETGPCGPCSEIFYDHGEEFSTPHLKLKDDQDILDDELRYVEIWNLVFMQFEKSKDGIKELPRPSIDTGAGLERITAIMQGKYWNYDTDLFKPIFNKLEKLSGKKYSEKKHQTSMRIIADHIRSSVMLITDGIIPSNEGRGYVLRRIIRRAVRQLKKLGIQEVSFFKLVPFVFEGLGKEYSQNEKNSSLALKYLEFEEKKFLETLEQGLKFLTDAIENHLENGSLSGEYAFKLYDTYGFPVDLTQIILSEKGFQVNMEGFNSSMKKQKEESKKSWKGAINRDDEIFHQTVSKYGKTNFLGYNQQKSLCKLLLKIEIEGATALIFDKTPFYGESGGQAGDSGLILNSNSDQDIIAEIFDTQKPVDGLFAHYTKNGSSLKEGQVYTLKIHTQKRALIERNHSATHLLQAALIQVLGDHVKQAGSSVTSERLRFDFTHVQAVTKDQLAKITTLINQEISNRLQVSSSIMSMDNATKEGATALFGEKYGDQVRVLKIGDFSIELCGGTHVKNSEEIGVFNIVNESSLSTGVRRIEALTSSTALSRLSKRSSLFEEIESFAKIKDEKVIKYLQTTSKDLLLARKEISQLRDKIQQINSKDLFQNLKKLNNHYQYIATEAPLGSDLRKLSDLFSDQYPKGVLILYKTDHGQASVLLRAPKDSPFHCANLLKTHIQCLEGRGGGKQNMAQGSGKSEKINQFIENVKKNIMESLL